MLNVHLKHFANEGLFFQWLVRHEPEIRAFIRAAVAAAHHVAEVMQNVSLIAWKKFSGLTNAETDFLRWVCVIARFEIMKFRRSLVRDRFVLDNDLVEQLCKEGEEELTLRTQQIAQLEACLEKLPRERRDFVIAAYTPGESIKALAQQLGKQPDAIYQLLRRIRHELEACILRQLKELGEPAV